MTNDELNAALKELGGEEMTSLGNWEKPEQVSSRGEQVRRKFQGMLML